jgi:tetratricopeptide (TPR) repeat protein
VHYWEKLRGIQEEMYVSDKEVLNYTYKNIGVCYMALGKPEKAEEFYHLALAIVHDLSAQHAS